MKTTLISVILYAICTLLPSCTTNVYDTKNYNYYTPVIVDPDYEGLDPGQSYNESVNAALEFGISAGDGYTDGCNSITLDSPYFAGLGYIQSIKCAGNTFIIAKYSQGSQEWMDAHDDWLNSDEPFPDELSDIEGAGYNDSKNSAEDAALC